MVLPLDSEAPVADLARFDEEWTKTSVSSDEMYSDVPDGTYEAVIENAHVGETASTGRPVVIWRLRITGPAAVGRVVTKHRVITENTLAYLKEDLDKCQLKVARLSELRTRIKELVDRPISIDKRTRDSRTNIYFRWESNRPVHDGQIEDVPF